MVNLLLVFMGGGTGAVCRFLVGMSYLRTFGPRQPYLATLGINVLGGLLMGLLVGWLALRGAGGQERARLLLAVGVLGGFTTFSSFSLETVQLIRAPGLRPLGRLCGWRSVLLSVMRGSWSGLLVMSTEPRLMVATPAREVRTLTVDARRSKACAWTGGSSAAGRT